MNYRFLLFFAVIILGLTGSAVAQTTAANTASGLRLAKMLPESDAVLVLDAKRLLNDALPQILSGNQPMLGEITEHADMIKSLTGIDLRQFDRVAVGATIKSVSAKEVDLSPVVLAQGKYTPASLLSAVKLASSDEYREEKIAGKTIYIFTPKANVIPAGALAKASNSMIGKMIDRAVKGIVSHEIGVGAFDANTVVFGPIARVRQAVGTGPRAGLSVLSLAGLQHGGVAGFGAKLSVGLSAIFGLDNDELGRNINSVKYLSGWMDQGDGSTIFRLVAKTGQIREAEDFLATLTDLQALGKALLAGSRSADKQVYSRLIDNARFTRVANELTIDLTIQQSDINVLIGEKK